MKFLILSVLIVTNLFAQGGAGIGGGGEPAEKPVFHIMSELESWIQSGGHRGLNLLAPLTHEEYKSRMLAVVQDKTLKVEFIDQNDPADEELQVIVDGSPKACRGFISRKDSFRHILCLAPKFARMSDEEQFRTVHHEVAGLAGVEHNIGARSDWSVSNQLSKFVKYVQVPVLAVLPEEGGPYEACTIYVDSPIKEVFKYEPKIPKNGVVQKDQIEKELELAERFNREKEEHRILLSKKQGMLYAKLRNNGFKIVRDPSKARYLIDGFGMDHNEMFGIEVFVHFKDKTDKANNKTYRIQKGYDIYHATLAGWLQGLYWKKVLNKLPSCI